MKRGKFIYKIDVIKKLKEVGYPPSRLRKEKLIGESSIQKFREGKMCDWEVIAVLCELFNCKLEDIVEYDSFAKYEEL